MKKLCLAALLAIGVVISLSTPMALLAQTNNSAGNEVGLPNPIRCADATCLVSQVIRYILGTIAVIATLMFIWGGVMMLTSGGNAEQVKKAKETLVWATIGIVIILISWAVIRFVLAGISGTSR